MIQVMGNGGNRQGGITYKQRTISNPGYKIESKGHDNFGTLSCSTVFDLMRLVNAQVLGVFLKYLAWGGHSFA